MIRLACLIAVVLVAIFAPLSVATIAVIGLLIACIIDAAAEWFRP